MLFRSALRDFTHRRIHLLPNVDSPTLLHLVRGAGSHEGELHVLCNLTENSQPIPRDINDGRALVFSSEMKCYHGDRESGSSTETLFAYECIALGFA